MTLRFVRAELVRHEVPGTPIGVRPEIPLGTVYEVAPETLQPMEWADRSDLNKRYVLQSLYAVREGDIPRDGYLPAELFEILAEEISA